jgi:tRNA(Ile)-lysidine synthase TilS/MesJ
MNAELSYSRWKDEFKPILESLSEKKVFMLFSGGKDSSLAMDFILRGSKEFAFDLDAHAGSFPVHRYPEWERERIGSYWKKRGVNIVWHELADTDEHVRSAPNPCLPCQELRKEVLKIILTESIDDWESLVLTPCHTLWDLVSYSIEHVLSDIYSDSRKVEDIKNSKRFMETAQRFYPFLRMKEGYAVFRPLIKYNSNDIMRAIEKKGIPILSIPCEFSGFRPKRILEGYYEKMGLHFDYSQVFKFAGKSLNLPDTFSYTSMEKEEYLVQFF